MTAIDFEHERTLHHEQLAHAVSQSMHMDNAFVDEIAPPQPPLPDGSFADSAASIQDRERFFAVLASIYPQSELSVIIQNLKLEVK